jgi:hypothetical protein
MLIGFFLYFNGPEVAWYAKPPAGPTCPTSLASGMQAVPSAGELRPNWERVSSSYEWNVANPNPTTGMAWRTWILTASP